MNSRILPKQPPKTLVNKSQRPALFLTCEHAGNKIPARYIKLFEKNQGVLQTHRASDPGAYAVAKEIERLTGTKLYSTKISRLIVDVNRSPDSETALSRWTKSLSTTEQDKIFKTYYYPYRSKIEADLAKSADKSRVLHLGIHSFSPYLDPSRKSCDIGILFDPKSQFEIQIADALAANLEMMFPALGIRLNFPYRGDADGLTTDLRQKYRRSPRSRPASHSRSHRLADPVYLRSGQSPWVSNYAGLEIEFNQAFLRKIIRRRSLKTFAATFVTALELTLGTL